jgi:PLD-like domain
MIYNAAMAGRVMAGIAIALICGAAGYYVHDLSGAPAISTQTMAAPPPDSVRVLYSLTAKRNDREIIALINSAQHYVYFAMYEFTLRDIADALVAAKKRGVDVEGVVDAVEIAKSYGRPILSELTSAGIAVKAEKHPDGNGIMHIKGIATEKAYAIGSYNWTASATTENDELLEIGTSSPLVQTYTSILKHLIDSYPAAGDAAPDASAGELDISEASEHVGQNARVRGTLLNAHTSGGGTVFLDFCKRYRTCPFSAVIFADDARQFGDLSKFIGKEITVSGKISSYQSRPEIIIRTPEQISASSPLE